MKVDANRVQPPVTEKSHHNKPLKTNQPDSKGPNKQVERSASKAEVAPPQNRAQGVLRLLQEGHFKGVAALRLRINFFDQLSTLEQENIQATAQESITELTLAMQEHIDGLNRSGLVEEKALPQLTEMTDTFVSEIQDSITGEKLDPQQLTMVLQQSYDNFRTSLQSLLLPPEPPPPQEAEAAQANPTEEILPAVKQSDDDQSLSMATLETEQPAGQAIAAPMDTMEESETQTQLNASLDALDSTFGSQLSNIEERLQGATLPSLPEQPDNKGAAFQKFLTIYQEMQSRTEAGSEPDEATVS